MSDLLPRCYTISVFVLVVFLAVLVRVAPYAGHPWPEAGYSASGVASVLRSAGHSGQDTTIYATPFTAAAVTVGGSAAALHRFSMVLFTACGLSSLESVSYYLRFFPLGGTLLLMLASLGLLNATSHDTRPPLANSLGLALFATLGSVTLITLSHRGLTNTAFGWTMLLLYFGATYRQNSGSEGRFWWLGIRATLAVGMIVLYHTVALVFALYVVVSALMAPLARRRAEFRFASTYLVLYGTFLILATPGFLTSYAHLMVDFLDFIRGEFTANRVLAERLVISTGALRTAFNIVADVMVAIPTLLVLWKVVVKPTSRTALAARRSGIVAFAVTLIPLAVLFYGFMGLPGLINRTSEYGSILSIASLAVLFGSRPNREESPRVDVFAATAYVAIAIAVVTSTIGYLSSDIRGNTFSPDELATARVASDYLKPSQEVFSDFRLGSALLLYGHTNEYGVTNYAPPRTITAQLNGIYYSDSVDTVTRTFDDYFPSMQFALVSEQMASLVPGVKLFDQNLAGPTPEQFNTLLRLPTVISSGQAFLLDLPGR